MLYQIKLKQFLFREAELTDILTTEDIPLVTIPIAVIPDPPAEPPPVVLPPPTNDPNDAITTDSFITNLINCPYRLNLVVYLIK